MVARVLRPGWSYFNVCLFVCVLASCTVAPTTSVSATSTPKPTQTPTAPQCATAGAGAVPLTIDLGGTTQPLPTSLTTNVASAGNLIPVDGALPQVAWKMLQQWNPPMIRLHLGFYGDGAVALPEEQQGTWNFDRLDALIGQLRTQNFSFYLEVRTAPPWMFDGAGQLRDQSFQEFATYMARLVGWYNKGGFTDDQGQFHASGHQGWVHYWEVWNEPNSGFEIPAPVADRPATWMAASHFAQLYDTATGAMRHVDATIATGGPTITSYPDIPYLRNFVHNVHQPLNFLSFHFYAIGDQTLPDAAIFNAVYGPRLQDRLVAANQILAQEKPGQTIPIWLDEVGVNEIAKPPSDPRGTSPLAYAFITQVFALAAAQHVGLLAQFPLVGSNQLALIDEQSMQVYRTYWYYLLLARAFPPGSQVLSFIGPTTSGLVGLAAVSADNQSLRLVLGNIRVANATDVGGQGVPLPIQITIQGHWHGTAPKAGASGTVWPFDAAAPTTALPPTCAIPVSAATGGLTTGLTIGGYGAAIIDLPLAT